MIERHDVTSTEQWLALRREFNDITASVAPALFGAHPYKTQLQLWLHLSGMVPFDDSDTPMMRRGRLVEKLGVDLIKEARPEWAVIKAGVYVRDPERRLGATPDFAVIDERNRRGNVQFKSVERGVFERTWRGEDGDIEPPLWVGIQTALEAHLTGAEFAMVGVCRIGHGIDFDLIEVPHTPGLIERLQDAAAAFWKSVEEKTPPAPDYIGDAGLLSTIFATPVAGKTVDLSGSNRIAHLAAEEERLAAALKETEEARKAVKAEVLDLLRDAELGMVNGEIVVSAKRVEVKEHLRKASSYRKVLFRKREEAA